MSTRFNPPGQLVLIRHGETEWSKSGQHTGLTDLPLTPQGEQAARANADLVTQFNLAHTLVSPLQRARRTAELAGLQAQEEPLLVEWDYGGYEGLSTPQIQENLGYEWLIMEHGVVPGKTPGETIEQVAARASLVLSKVQPWLEDGDVALVAHSHILRVLTATFLHQAPREAEHYLLDTAAHAVLEYSRGVPSIRRWNLYPDG